MFQASLEFVQVRYLGVAVQLFCLIHVIGIKQTEVPELGGRSSLPTGTEVRIQTFGYDYTEAEIVSEVLPRLS